MGSAASFSASASSTSDAARSFLAERSGSASQTRVEISRNSESPPFGRIGSVGWRPGSVDLVQFGSGQVRVLPAVRG